MEPPDDRELILRAQQGDRDALETLVEAHFRPAYNFAYKLAKGADEASDIVQEGFARACQRLASFNNDANFRTWLYRIITNVFLDRRKKQRKRPKPPFDYVPDA
jgi:RNA polymerase sigma-70 factor (ECF subfamily)